jgi:hypothetical protein
VVRDDSTVARARIPLPAGFADRAFSVAEADKAGLGEGRLRNGDLARPLHGLRSAAHLTGFGEVGQLAAGAALLLPDDVAFSHCTAAALLGLPLPRALEHAVPLHVMRPSKRNRVDRPQVRAHRGLENRDTTVTHGLRVTAPADTWVDLGELLGVEDLVVVGDQVARRLESVAPLADALAARRRPRGAVALGEALRWVRVGSDSAMESRSRLLFVRHGLPEPLLNKKVTSEEDGGFLCRSDFVWEQEKVIGEYQGGDHFASFERGDDDISRRLLVEDEDWKYVEITKRDYFNPARRRGLLLRLARYLGIERVADRPSPAWEGRSATPSTVSCSRTGTP